MCFVVFVLADIADSASTKQQFQIMFLESDAGNKKPTFSFTLVTFDLLDKFVKDLLIYCKSY